MAAVEAGDRQAWLELFADDAMVEDPIGPSPFDPDGKGHRGIEAIAAFYDEVIAANESIRFDIHQSFLCGDEVANIGVIRITFAGGSAIEVDGVYTYRRSPDDKIAAIRAFWEPARSARCPDDPGGPTAAVTPSRRTRTGGGGP